MPSRGDRQQLARHLAGAADRVRACADDFEVGLDLRQRRLRRRLSSSRRRRLLRILVQELDLRRPIVLLYVSWRQRFQRPRVVQKPLVSGSSTASDLQMNLMPGPLCAAPHAFWCRSKSWRSWYSAAVPW